MGEFFAVCQENHTRFKLEKCEFMQETMQYPGFDVGYGWWTPAASKAKPLMDAKVRHEDPKKGLHDVRSFIGACIFYRRHIKNFTHTSAILTDLIKKSTTWRWGPQEQQAFDEHKDKVANAKCLGVPRAQGEILLVTDASNVGGGGTLFQWQALEKEEFDSAISQWGTEGLNRDGTLKHSYPDDKWVLVPLGHWNWKWNQARGNYSTYEQELLAGMLVLSSQARLLGSNPVVWLCDQEPVRSFQKGPPPEKAKLRRWWTYLSQLRSAWLGTGALPSALSRADCRSCMEYCWNWAQAPSGTRGTWRLRTAWKPGRSTGRLSYSSRQKARTANITSWASVRSVWVLGTRTFQRSNGPKASTSMAPRTAFHRWAMSWAWRRQKSLMARLRSAARSARRWRMSSSRAAACLSSSSCSWPCVAGRNLGDAPRSSSVSRSAASDRMPCGAASAWYAAGAHGARVS